MASPNSKFSGTVVRAVALVSQDGAIADAAGKYDSLTCPADLRHLREQIAAADCVITPDTPRPSGAVLLGRKTFEDLPDRVKNQQRMIIVTSSSPGLSKKEGLEHYYWNPNKLPGLHALCDRLRLSTLLVLGAYNTAWSDGIDEILLTVAPSKLGENALPLIDREIVAPEQLLKKLIDGSLGFRLTSNSPLPCDGQDYRVLRFQRSDL